MHLFVHNDADHDSRNACARSLVNANQRYGAAFGVAYRYGISLIRNLTLDIFITIESAIYSLI